VEKLGKNCRKILRALLQKTFLQFFHNSSTILPRVEEFSASGLAWRRIVEGIIVEKLWKHLVNSAPGHQALEALKRPYVETQRPHLTFVGAISQMQQQHSIPERHK
jgi:hypothetical protein